MAGAGYKLFSTGDVLSASDVNTYLQQQTVMVFASAAARTTALSGVLAEGMVSYLKDTDVVEIYTGAAWVSLDDPNAIQNSIVDAKGDIISATADNTPARLAVGANNTVLTADSSTATGLKWATPATASSALTFITSSTFSNVASVTVDSCFTSTYETYLIDLIDVYGATATDDLYFQMRYGSTTQVTGYYGSWVYWRPVTSAIAGAGWRNAAQHTLNDYVGDSADSTHGNIWVSKVGVAGRPAIWGTCGNGSSEGMEAFGGTLPTTSQTYSGFLLKSSSSNITGTVRIYGLAKS